MGKSEKIRITGKLRITVGRVGAEEELGCL